MKLWWEGMGREPHLKESNLLQWDFFSPRIFLLRCMLCLFTMTAGLQSRKDAVPLVYNTHTVCDGQYIC